MAELQTDESGSGVNNTDGPFILQLPPEIQVEILSELPGREVMLMRCVCTAFKSIIDHNEAWIAGRIIERRKEELQLELDTFDYNKYTSFLTALRHWLDRKGLWMYLDLRGNRWDSRGFHCYYTDICHGNTKDADLIWMYALRLIKLHVHKHIDPFAEPDETVESLVADFDHWNCHRWTQADHRRNADHDIQMVLEGALCGIRLSYMPTGVQEDALRAVRPGKVETIRPYPNYDVAALTSVYDYGINRPSRQLATSSNTVEKREFRLAYDLPYRRASWFNGVMKEGPLVGFAMPTDDFEHTLRHFHEVLLSPDGKSLLKAAVLDKVFVW